MKKNVSSALYWFVLVNLFTCMILNTAWQFSTNKPATRFEMTRAIVKIQENIPWLPWFYVKPGSNRDGGMKWFWVWTDIDASLRVVENPFHIGQKICAVPDSIREPFPDKGRVVEINELLVKIQGYDGWIHNGHFRDCWFWE